MLREESAPETKNFEISPVQLLSHCPTLCVSMDYSTPGFPVHHQLLELAQTHIHRVSDAIQPSYPLLSPSLPAFNLSQDQGLFPMSPFFTLGGQSTGASASASPSNEYSGLISFRIDWFDLLAVQGTLKSLLQHHSSKASIFQCSAFFIVQLSHLYMTTGKTIALTRQTFSGKVMSLLFNILSKFSHSVVSNSLWPHWVQHALSITNSWSLLTTHAHWVGDTIQPSHPLSSPSPLTFSLSQHQGLFQGVSSSRQLAKVLEHTRLSCTPLSPGVCSNSRPLSWWCHPTISSWVSASASVLPMNIQDWFPLGWTDWPPCSPKDSQESRFLHYLLFIWVFDSCTESGGVAKWEWSTLQSVCCFYPTLLPSHFHPPNSSSFSGYVRTNQIWDGWQGWEINILFCFKCPKDASSITSWAGC